MTKEQFIQLLRKPATINLNLVSELEDITERFPYYQNAHLLLAKQYQGHENIRFESYLRKASAYAPDRTVLYRLIKEEIPEVIHMEAVQEKVQEPVAEMESVHVQQVENTAADTTEKEPIESTPILHIVKEEAENISENTVDPRAIIEQRLRELNGEKNEVIATPSKAEDQKEQLISAEPPAPETVVQTPEVTGPINIETLYQQRQEKAESTSGNEPKPVKKEPGTHSFSEWLQLKRVPVVPVEKINELKPEEVQPTIEPVVPKKEKVTDHIIERFIQSEPRIVPAKSEFYSPGNMARKSLVEHEDLISETLARIYAQQGNLRKAIETYERLKLKIPEKSTYFAALIKELEQKGSS
jgi:tetratricopeptide (TPR) repeat protein